MNRRTKRRLILSSTIAGSLVVLTAGAIGVRAWYREAQVAESRRTGLELYAAKRYEESLQPLSRAMQNASDLEVLLALADARRSVPAPKLRHLQVASGMFAKAETLDPGNRASLMGQLDCAIGLGYVDQIPDISQRILAIEPDSVRAREAVLEVRALQGRWADVIRIAEELQGIQPREIRWRAVQMQALGASGADAEGRLSLVDRWLEEAPDDVGLAFIRADLLRAVGRVPESREIYARIAARGVDEVRLLPPLLEGLESTGQASLVDAALEATRSRLPDPSGIFPIEGEGLLYAGRLSELQSRLASIDAATAPIARLRAATAYLTGNRESARSILEEARKAGFGDGSTELLEVMRIAFGEGARRSRVEEIRTSVRLVLQDPISAIVLSELLIEAGEFDEAAKVLTQAFDQSGRRIQPVGIRLVRLLAGLGRVPEALAVARDLGIRYQADGAVAAAILEAWSGALQSGFVPSRVFGALASDSPEALFDYWEAMGRPRELGPLVAEVFAKRSMYERADAIVVDLLASATTAEQALALIDAAERGGREKVLSVVERAASLPSGTNAAISLATRLSALGREVQAIEVLRRAEGSASGADARRIGRALRFLQASPEGIAAVLAAELKDDPTMECAMFVLGRPEIWRSDADSSRINAATVEAAVAIIQEAMGPTSARAAIAEATMHLVFHGEDQARLSNSLASLIEIERSTPESIAVLATLARLLEVTEPPDLARSAEFLTRAVQLQPGNPELYPDLVRALQGSGEFEAAARAIDAYARLIGDDLEGERRAATMLESQGEFVTAAELRAQVSGRTNDSVDRLALVRAKVRAGDVAGAEEILRGLAGEEGGFLARRELARLYAAGGRLPLARELLATAGSGAVEAARNDSILAELEFAFGDIAMAEAAARRAVTAQSLPADRLLLARVLQRAGKEAEARELVLALITAGQDADGLLPVAAVILAGDRSDDGRSAMQRALGMTRDRHPDFADAIRVLDAATDSSGMLRPSGDDLRDVRELTVKHSGSPLVWRMAAQMHAAAGQTEEAARLAMLGVARLPADESLAELAVGVAVGAGRIDDAAAVASAWRRMTGANELNSRTAEALVELVRRSPARAVAALAPMTSTIVASPGADDALALLVSSRVLSNEADALEGQLRGLAADRRAIVIDAWTNSIRALEPGQAVVAIRALEAYVGAVRIDICVALLTELCAEGWDAACVDADRALAGLGAETGGIPRPLLEADLAAARGDSDAAGRFLSLISQVLGVTVGNATELQGAVASDVAVKDRFFQNPLGLAAANNLADHLRRSGKDVPSAVILARLVTQAIPESADAADTLFRALLASGDLVAAALIADANPDRLIGSLERAEVALASGDQAMARRSLLQADGLSGRTGAVRWSVRKRIDAIRAAISAAESRSGGQS